MPSHDRKSFLHGHLAWHVALTHLDEGDLDGALAIYEQHIKPAGRPYPPLNIFTDGASLLWRLSLAGKAGLEPHWRDVAAYGEKYFPQAGRAFCRRSFCAGRRRQQTAPPSTTRLAQLEARAADGKLAPGALRDRPVSRRSRATSSPKATNDGASPLCSNLRLSELARIGGSRRRSAELWEDTLIDSSGWPTAASASRPGSARLARRSWARARQTPTHRAPVHDRMAHYLDRADGRCSWVCGRAPIGHAATTEATATSRVMGQENRPFSNWMQRCRPASGFSRSTSGDCALHSSHVQRRHERRQRLAIRRRHGEAELGAAATECRPESAPIPAA